MTLTPLLYWVEIIVAKKRQAGLIVRKAFFPSDLVTHQFNFILLKLHVLRFQPWNWLHNGAPPEPRGVLLKQGCWNMPRLLWVWNHKYKWSLQQSLLPRNFCILFLHLGLFIVILFLGIAAQDACISAREDPEGTMGQL